MTDFPALYGEHPGLDFANTVNGRAQDEPEEHLHGYRDMVRWAAYAQWIGPEERRDLDALAGQRPDAARGSHLAGVAVREAIHRVFAGMTRDLPPDEDDLALIQRAYAAAMAAARLRPGEGHFGWDWPDDSLDQVWWPAVLSVIDLLTTGPAGRVKVCASTQGCAGLFLDTSKNGSRRWCRMADCGTEAKIHRQTARRRDARR